VPWWRRPCSRSCWRTWSSRHPRSRYTAPRCSRIDHTPWTGRVRGMPSCELSPVPGCNACVAGQDTPPGRRPPW
jgi:hypothetical protein